MLHNLELNARNDADDDDRSSITLLQSVLLSLGLDLEGCSLGLGNSGLGLGLEVCGLLLVLNYILNQVFIIFHVLRRIKLITGSMYQIADNHLSETMYLLTFSQSLLNGMVPLLVGMIAWSIQLWSCSLSCKNDLVYITDNNTQDTCE